MRPEVLRAMQVIPGGVSSPLRACRRVGAEPLVVAAAHGEKLRDIDGNEYIDFMFGFGPLILGHSPEVVVQAIQRQSKNGLLFGGMSMLEVELAETICGSADFLQQLRFVCSGTEAVMSALRLARAYTGRTRVLRFLGGYHGHFDLVQNKADNELLAAGLDPQAMRSNILVPYNDIEAVARAFAEHPGQIAAVLIEPIACNMSLVTPQDGFLLALRKLCDREQALLVFDEVISGFRFTFGPVSNLLGVDPDLSCFGKIIGGGTPVGCFGGRRDVMTLLDNEQILQGGTFAGNPLTMAAGLATMAELARPGFYEELERKGALLEAAMTKHRERLELDFVFSRMNSVFAFAFVPRNHPIRRHTDLQAQRRDDYAHLYQAMRSRGYHLAPDVEETMYVSAATSDDSLRCFAVDACEALAQKVLDAAPS